MERAAKISGARFFFLKGDALLLEQSIMRYALDTLRSAVSRPSGPPLMMRRERLRRVSSTSTTSDRSSTRWREKTSTSSPPPSTRWWPCTWTRSSTAASLPIKYCGFSPNFRVEAGAHGKDTKGIFRTHQFYKVEQVVFSEPGGELAHPRGADRERGGHLPEPRAPLPGRQRLHRGHGHGRGEEVRPRGVDAGPAEVQGDGVLQQRHRLPGEEAHDPLSGRSPRTSPGWSTLSTRPL